MNALNSIFRVVSLILLLALSPLTPAETGQAETVMVYNTYLLPPFVAETGGLAEELVAYLNQKLAGEYRFQLDNIPRARLVRDVIDPPDRFGGIVLFLNPRFVADAERTKFFWSPPIATDHNILVFRGATPPPIKELGDLKGMRFGAIKGNRYKGLDDLVEANLITREYAPTELANFKKIADDRIDFTQTYASTFNVLQQRRMFGGPIATVTAPGDEPFTRHILIGRKNPELAKRIAAIAQAMPSDPKWKQIADAYLIGLPKP